MRKRLSLILSCLFLGIGIAMAQHTVNGVVISSEDNEPIIGATVKIKGTNTGVVTNIDGEFSISSPTANPQLEITYVGMTKVTVKGTQNMKVTMYPEASRELSEVVVTGLYILYAKYLFQFLRKISAFVGIKCYRCPGFSRTFNSSHIRILRQ